MTTAEPTGGPGSAEPTVRYSIDPASRIVSIRYAGNPRFDEWAAMMLAIFRDPPFTPGYGFLADRRVVTQAPTTEYINRVVAFCRQHQEDFGHGRWATVVAGVAAYGMARMAQGLVSGLPLKVGVFTDIDEAREWLTA